MTTALMAAPHIAAIDLNQPGTYLHWSIFEISVANLVVIAVMVAIFGAALLLPFPHRNRTWPAAAEPAPGSEPVPGAMGDDADARMWTARARRWALRTLPPQKLLPDRQPAYVASWVYVFGVATLAALVLAIVSGFAIAIGGTDWWHTNPVGHFFNSMHLWRVELFMAFMVIHLWGKFWMAAWRGRRALTWITGVVAFVASVVECFTGYVSQQNFDSQWIATNGKDAFNAVGVGAFFNVMNFGQMLLWHVVLMPIILVALVGAHVLLVRVRGVSHPLPAKRIGWRDRAGRKAAKAADAAPWRGRTRRYDILKEGTIATAIAPALVLIMAAVLSSPDVPSVTVQSWAKIGAGRLPRHRGHRTRRHRPGRLLRAALQQRDRRGAAGRAGQLAEAVRRHPARQRRPGLRRHAAEEAGPVQPGAGGRAGHLHQRPRCPAAEVGHRLRATRSPRSSSSTAPRWCRQPATGPSR